MEAWNEASRQGSEAWETPRLCSDVRKEAAKLVVLRTAFCNCPVLSDLFKGLGKSWGFFEASLLFLWVLV